MSHGSLRLRLLLAAALSITFALFLAGLALIGIFEAQVRTRLTQELNNHLLQLVASLDVARDGRLRLKRELVDPRFDQPLSGMYWEVRSLGDGDSLTSRSLWDVTLGKLPDGTPTGPEGEPLLGVSRTIKMDTGGTSRSFDFTVATHFSELTNPVDSFRQSIAYYLGLIGLMLLAATWIQVSVGLSPLKALSEQLKDIASGNRRRLEGEFPDEVAPLAQELNGMLATNEASIERARARAGDLAHGLKTPLTVLAAVARDVAAKGLTPEAREIEGQAETMRLHIERQLARARIASSHNIGSIPFKANAERVIAAMKRSSPGDHIQWELSAAPDDVVAMDRQDLTELLGNLLDNAAKWAKSKVTVTYNNGKIDIEDDGPGVPDDELDHIAERGLRLDESKQGSGLGLAIVKDIAEVYGAAVDFSRSQLGGLRVNIRLKP